MRKTKAYQSVTSCHHYVQLLFVTVSFLLWLTDAVLLINYPFLLFFFFFFICFESDRKSAG